jgi:hypothetical protein
MSQEKYYAIRLRNLADILNEKLATIEAPRPPEQEPYEALGWRRGIATALRKVVVPELYKLADDIDPSMAEDAG